MLYLILTPEYPQIPPYPTLLFLPSTFSKQGGSSLQQAIYDSWAEVAFRSKTKYWLREFAMDTDRVRNAYSLYEVHLV